MSLPCFFIAASKPGSSFLIASIRVCWYSMIEIVTGPLLLLAPGEQALSPPTATMLTARAAMARVRFIAVPLLLVPLATLPFDGTKRSS